MPTLNAYLHQVAVAKRLCRIIFWSGTLTVLLVGLGTAFALYQNWQIRLETSQLHLIRSADMANMLVDGSLLDVTKALDASKRELETALDKGALTPQLAYLILMRSNQGLTVHDQTKPVKLRFWIGADGRLVARSDEYPKESVDYSDRLYFNDLLTHPERKWSIGPLVWAPAPQQWVFHVAIAMRNRRGQFEGVLVQQILKSELNIALEKYMDPNELGQVMAQFSRGAVSLNFRGLSEQTDIPVTVLQAWTHDAMASGARKGSHVGALPSGGLSGRRLVAFAKSPLFGLVTFATLPMGTLIRSFLWENHFFLIFVALGMLFVITIFHQVYRIALQLTIAVDKSLHDPLTKLHNRRALDETLPHLLGASQRGQIPVSVLFMDIDFFRRFNEEFGHETGDLALVAVANALRTCCRRPLDLLCRWGGEEFVAVLPDTNAAGAEKVAVDMLQAVRNIALQSPTGQAMHLTCSIGSVTATVTQANRTDDLIDCADKAMQAAKRGGRNQHAVWPSAPPPPFLTFSAPATHN